MTSSKRARVARQFEVWCEKNNLRPCGQAMMAFLDSIGVFDEEQVNGYLKTIRKDDLSYTGIKKFEPDKYDTVERKKKKR